MKNFQWDRLAGIYRITIGCIFAALFYYLYLVASQLQIDYFDSFVNFLNARAVGLRNGALYFWKPGPVWPLILSPVFFIESFFPSTGLAFTASHFVAVSFYGLLVFIFYKHLRLFFNTEISLTGTLLFSLNPSLIHYAPFGKEDIPATFLTALTFYLYLKSSSQRTLKNYWWVCLGITSSMAARYNLIPLLFAVIGSYEIFEKWMALASKKKSWADILNDLPRKFIFFAGLPLLLFFLIPVLLFPYLGISSVLNAPQKFINYLLLQYKFNSTPEPASLAYVFMLRACTWPILLLSAVGIVRGVLEKERRFLFYGLWLAIFFLYQTYLIGPKEVRYLFPLFPAFYFFVSLGAKTAWDLLHQKLNLPGITLKRAAVLGAMLLVMTILPLKKTVAVCTNFLNQVYPPDSLNNVSL
ncbi:MAG: glycosyltransferase family 39 protein, partial [Candidatus Omnitrophica bacterium]|nr:glycosyltransferase family 39 protein [Candidatus Omnitrophota bacterium]